MRREYYAGQIELAKHSTKTIFQVVKQLSSLERVTAVLPASTDYCNKVADHFTNKIAKIYATFPESSRRHVPVPGLETPWSEDKFALCPLVDDDVLRLMEVVKTGSPLDLVPPKFVQLGKTIIAPVFTSLLNLSFGTGQVCNNWKHAMVVPLLKKPSLDPALPENVRPISLLPYVAKIAEKHLNGHLSKFLEERRVLHNTQSGFRPMHSTESALLLAAEVLRAAADEGQTTALVLLDLSAAFDTFGDAARATKFVLCIN